MAEANSASSEGSRGSLCCAYEVTTYTRILVHDWEVTNETLVCVLGISLRNWPGFAIGVANSCSHYARSTVARVSKMY